MTDQRAPIHPRPHRLVGAVLATLVVLAGLVTTGPSASAAGPAQEFLVVADPGSEAVYVYRASDHRLTGRLDDITLSTHGGTLRLPSGRLVGVDDGDGRVVEIAVSRSGRPSIAESADLPGDWEGTAWAAADPGLRYFAVSGGSEEAPTISVVDLHTFAVHQIPVTPEPDSTGDAPETQVYLAGRPLQLVYTTGGLFHTVPLSRVLRGQSPTVTSTAPVGPSTHGPVVSRRGDAVYSTTADGFDGASIRGATLGDTTSVAYSETRDVVQLYRPRLAHDGRTVWGSVAEDTGLSAADWADTRNDVDVIDLSSGTSRLIRLPDGTAGRLALSRQYAGVTTIHPDGDVLTLVDARRGSPTYQRVVGTIGLPASVAGSASHFTTLDPSGDEAYVTQGGDGRISVVDTETRRITSTIRTPGALTGGGYLTVIRKGEPVSDLVAR